MVNSATESGNLLQQLSNNLADIVEQSGRSVVAVNGRRRMSSAGVHWRSGIVVTADHTINREEDITVTLSDDRTITATLIGRDSGTDLALLRLAETDALPTANLSNSTELRVGEMVLAIARFPESGISASLGVISTLGGTWRTWHGGKIDQFIRPSVMLYPGFSGGSLVNAQGKVVGINTAGPRQLVLTIPTSTVNRVVEQILTGKRIKPGYLGLGMQPIQLPQALRKQLNISGIGGVIIVSVEPDAPADKAGILIGDILVALNDKPINDVSDVHAMLDPERVGKPLNAQIIRGGTLTQITIIVGEKE
ncbi:trypsin-like peptidase domain-containing protein [Phormidium sp. LEGE 05292]|uniref:S1C family serine protease n=1 Tax=[Phormidium] sp. LEGE 05292 TaxID=767427 RepID=UPI001880C54D|nr:trypsin-like peptidase domain-containing protein [Phormidium sp. LEGE 05292]MBE9223872.1 trypsin-like peptidase domain-containing protein [Phormidium sp. LEGE 05292]